MSQETIDITTAGGWSDETRWAAGLTDPLDELAKFYHSHKDIYGQPVEGAEEGKLECTGLLGYLRDRLEAEQAYGIDLNAVVDLEAPGEHRRALAGLWSASSRTGVVVEQKLFKVEARSGYSDFDRVLVTQIASERGVFAERRYVMIAVDVWHVSGVGHPTDRGWWYKTAGVVGAVQSPSTGEVTCFRATTPRYDLGQEDNGAGAPVRSLLEAMRLQWTEHVINSIQSLV